MKTSTRLACFFALALSAIATGPTAWGQWDSGVRQSNYQKQLPTTVDASNVPATFAQRVDPEIDRQMRSLAWRCVGPFVGNRGCGVEMHPTDRNVFITHIHRAECGRLRMRGNIGCPSPTARSMLGPWARSQCPPASPM